MAASDHFGFIVAAYAAAVAVVGGLTAWVMLDYRAQLRSLAKLEAKGLARRSATAHQGPTMRQAEEEA